MGGIKAKDKRDIYYRAAKEFGFRARSAFKLLQIQEYFHIFNKHSSDDNNQHTSLRIVDLCAAPGAWSEVCQLLCNASDSEGTNDTQILTVDLQSMNPIPGVTVIKGDISRQSTVTDIMNRMNNQYANIVLFDGAPDVTGLHSVDESIQHTLLLHAIHIASALLKQDENSIFVGKIFRGNRCSIIYAYLCTLFSTVTLCKPRASRNASIEAFVVCIGYLHEPALVNINESIVIPDDTLKNSDSIAQQRVHFVSCGGGFKYVKDADLKQCANLDSDKTYPLSYRLQSESTLNSQSADSDGTTVIQHRTKKVIDNKPIDTPYRIALEMKRNNQLQKAWK